MALPLLRIHDPPPDNRKESYYKFSGRHPKFLLALAQSNGLTDLELAGATATGNANACCRRREMTVMGLVEEGNERRRTPSGSTAKVWRLTDAGKMMAEELQ